MRLLYISSGKKTLSDLNPSIIGAFREIAREETAFQFESYFTEQEPLKHLDLKIQNFKPDCIVVFGHDAYPVMKNIKNLNVPIGLWVVNDPYNIANYEWKVPEYDFIITQDSGTVSYYRRKKRKPCIYLPLAVNPNNYYPMNMAYQYDVSFVGNGWPGRISFFDQLIPSLVNRKFILIGKGWDKLKHYHQIKNAIVDQTIEPVDVATIYNQSKIVLNIHRDRNDIHKNPQNLPAYTPNNRTFDIAGCKTFQLATCRRDLNLFYELDKEIVCYKTVQDCIEKIDQYLQDDPLREEIAQRAYERTMKDHTYHSRLKEAIKRLQTVGKDETR
jgi:spore maturation protein CgeB